MSLGRPPANLNGIWYNSEKPINNLLTIVELLPCRRKAIMETGSINTRASLGRRIRNVGVCPLFFPLGPHAACSMGTAASAGPALPCAGEGAALQGSAPCRPRALIASSASMHAGPRPVHCSGRPRKGATGCMLYLHINHSVPTISCLANVDRAATASRGHCALTAARAAHERGSRGGAS
jgi:hypothetical protein